MKIKKSMSFWIFSFWSVFVVMYSSWIFFRGAIKFLPEMVANIQKKQKKMLEISGGEVGARYRAGKELATFQIEETDTDRPKGVDLKSEPFSKGMTKYKNGLTWYYNLDDALEVCRIQNKQVLAVFLASDWSVPSAKLKSQVTSLSRFRNLVKKNFVLVEIDVTKPYKEHFDTKSKTKSKKVKKVEESSTFSLKRADYVETRLKRFNIQAFPTVVVFSSRGREVLRLRGLGNVTDENWVTDYIGKLEKITVAK